MRSWRSCGCPTGPEQPGLVGDVPAQGRSGTGCSSKVPLEEPKFCSSAERGFPPPQPSPPGSPRPGAAVPGRRARGHQRALRARASRSGPRGPGPSGSPERLRTRSGGRRLRGAPGGGRHSDPPTPPQSHGDNPLRQPGTRRGWPGDTARLRTRSGHGHQTELRARLASRCVPRGAQPHGLLRRAETITGCCGSCARSRLSPSSGGCSEAAPGRPDGHAPTAGVPRIVWREGSRVGGHCGLVQLVPRFLQ